MTLFMAVGSLRRQGVGSIFRAMAPPDGDWRSSFLAARRSGKRAGSSWTRGLHAVRADDLAGAPCQHPRPMRLNKHISESGFCSRREADRLISEGRVLLNGQRPGVGAQVEEGDKVVI